MTTNTTASARVHGRVKWFNKEKGYGFLVGPDCEAFVHCSNVQGIGGTDGGYLTEGDLVTFEIEESAKGPNARRVRPMR